MYPRAMADSDCVLVMGSNMAENHPVAFRWPMNAKVENGAKLIHVDPRFTRTSAMADILGMAAYFPSRNEQQRIAGCLGSLGDLIAAEGRKLEALRQQQIGAQHQHPREGLGRAQTDVQRQ